jgi:hypothetical protein
MNQTVVTCRTIDTIDFSPTVIVGFYQSGKKESFSRHCDTLQAQFPDADIIGCSTESNLYNKPPHLDTDGTHLCVFACVDIDKEAYSIQRISTDEADEIATDSTKRYRALLLASSYFGGMENTLKRLREKIGEDGLFGGIASVASETDRGDVFYRGRFWEESMLVWLIDQERYRLEGTTSHHFQPVGFEMEITAAEGNTIHEIENRPALEIAEEIIGTLTPQSITSFEHPFFLKQETGLTFDEAPLCSILSIDREQKSIEVYRNIEVRNTVKVGISLDRKAQKAQLNVFKKYKNKHAVAFLFNGIGIKGNLGSMETLYLMHLKQSLRMPFVGFHTFGEFGPVNSRSASVLHNQTISLAVLSERRK